MVLNRQEHMKTFLFPMCRCAGVVNGMDLKSIGLRPREFKSRRCRARFCSFFSQPIFFSFLDVMALHFAAQREKRPYQQF